MRTIVCSFPAATCTMVSPSMLSIACECLTSYHRAQAHRGICPNDHNWRFDDGFDRATSLIVGGSTLLVLPVLPTHSLSASASAPVQQSLQTFAWNWVQSWSPNDASCVPSHDSSQGSSTPVGLSVAGALPVLGSRRKCRIPLFSLSQHFCLCIFIIISLAAAVL